jgi:hypothetical protein
MDKDKACSSIPKSISIPQNSTDIQQSIQNSTVSSPLVGDIGLTPVGSSIQEPISLQYPSLDFLQSFGNSNGISLVTGSSGTATHPVVQSIGNSNRVTGSSDAAVPHPVVQSIGNSNGVSLFTGSSGAAAHPVVQSIGNANEVSLLTGSSGADAPLPVLFLPAMEPSPLSFSPLTRHLASIPATNQTLQNSVSFSVPAAAAATHLSTESQLSTIQAAAKPAAWASSGQYCRILYLDQDDDTLSPYQCLVRKQIEVFQATELSLQDKSQGRNRSIVLNQIGIRCRHCGRLPGKYRAKGAVFFPSQLDGLYQTAQNMANKHLLHDCREMPTAIREDLCRVRLTEKGSKTRKSAYGGGRHYWADCLAVLGVVQSPDRRLFLAVPTT